MTTLKLGWTNPLTDAFGAHPVLGPVLDLNDGSAFTLVSPDGLELPPPKRTLVPAGNIRSQGERGMRAIYRQNREVVARVIVGPSGSAANLLGNVRALAQWLAAPPAIPITLQYQPFNGTAPVYLDVVGAAHDIPADESDWLRLQFEPVELVFVARPGLRGDRLTLQNLVVNPGFEAPSGPPVQVFSDPLNTTNAFSTVTAPAPTVASNQMTLATGSVVTFGSPNWNAINLWQVRLQYATNETLHLCLHWVDANNHLLCRFMSGTGGFQLAHRVGGVYNVLAQANVTLTNGAWYWLQITQFPSVPGDPPNVSATLFNDASGAVGTVVAALGPVATFDAVTALSGVSALRCVAGPAVIGGAGVTYPFATYLFGPGGWPQLSNFGTGYAAGAWDTSWGNVTGVAPTTTPNGPVTSFGAVRIDAAPAGTLSAFWYSYLGGAPAGTSAIPVAGAGNTLGVAGWVKSVYLGANATVILGIGEYDANGTFLRQGTVQSVSGPTANLVWYLMGGTYTTGANCAYVQVQLGAVDTSSPGASASAQVWFDNVQVWNETTTGQSSMPYCELRFPQSPSQLLVSGLLGDLPAPAHLALGTYVSSLPTGGQLSFAAGRRGSVSANAQLVGPCMGWHSAALSPQAASVLDASSYGGFYEQATVTAGWNPRPVSGKPADLGGVYHMLCRFLSQQALGNLGNVEVRAVTQQRLQAWYGQLNSSDQLGTYYGPYQFPLAQSNVWTAVDAGQATLPPFNQGALTDPTQTYLTPRPQWADLTGGGSVCQVGWGALLPVDGSLLVGTLLNPSNAPFSVTNEWVWLYFDGLLVNRAGSGDGPAWTYSLETAPLPNPAHAGGGPGSTGTGAINVNSGADPYLTLDPTLMVGGASATGGGVNQGVNQLVAYIADQNAAVLPFHGEIQYSPLFLYPR